MHTTAPKYVRIKEDLIAGVASRRFHDRLPSENELARRHRVSRMTARKALDELVRYGIARRIPGKGTFLKTKDFAQAYFHLHPFSENARIFNVSTRSRLIHAGIVDLPPWPDTKLPGRQAVCLRRVHFLDEQPACHERRYVHLDLAAEILGNDFAVQSIHDLLTRRLGLTISRVWQRLEATGMPPGIAGDLETAPQTPAFCMHQRLYATDDPISYVIYYMRSDLYAFEDTFAPQAHGLNRP